MDGVDACLARISLSADQLEFQIQDNVTVPFTADEKEAIARSLTGTAEEVAELHFRLGEAYARVARDFLEGRPVDLAGCHGQTVAHRDRCYTLQVGTAAHLNQRLRVPVASNFREADVAAGFDTGPGMGLIDEAARLGSGHFPGAGHRTGFQGGAPGGGPGGGSCPGDTGRLVVLGQITAG